MQIFLLIHNHQICEWRYINRNWLSAYAQSSRMLFCQDFVRTLQSTSNRKWFLWNRMYWVLLRFHVNICICLRVQWNCEPIFILNMSYLLMPLAVGPIFGQCTHNDGKTEIVFFVFNFVAQIKAAENKHRTCVTMLDARMQLHFKVCENTYLHICNQIVLGMKREQKRRQIIIFIVWCVCRFNCISGWKIRWRWPHRWAQFFFSTQNKKKMWIYVQRWLEFFFSFLIFDAIWWLCVKYTLRTYSTHFIYRIDGNR